MEDGTGRTKDTLLRKLTLKMKLYHQVIVKIMLYKPPQNPSGLRQSPFPLTHAPVGRLGELLQAGLCWSWLQAGDWFHVFSVCLTFPLVEQSIGSMFFSW